MARDETRRRQWNRLCGKCDLRRIRLWIFNYQLLDPYDLGNADRETLHVGGGSGSRGGVVEGGGRTDFMLLEVNQRSNTVVRLSDLGAVETH